MIKIALNQLSDTIIIKKEILYNTKSDFSRIGSNVIDLSNKITQNMKDSVDKDEKEESFPVACSHVMRGDGVSADGGGKSAKYYVRAAFYGTFGIYNYNAIGFFQKFDAQFNITASMQSQNVNNKCGEALDELIVQETVQAEWLRVKLIVL